ADDRDVDRCGLRRKVANGPLRRVHRLQRHADDEWNIRLAAHVNSPFLSFRRVWSLAEPDIQSLRRYEPVQVLSISAPPSPEALAQRFLSPLPGICLECAPMMVPRPAQVKGSARTIWPTNALGRSHFDRGRVIRRKPFEPLARPRLLPVARDHLYS